MLTLEKLTNELDFNQVDEIIGGKEALAVANTWWDLWTTAGGTSGVNDGCLTRTTDYCD